MKMIDEQIEPDNSTSILSYQLRSPLTSIKAALGLLLTGKLDPQTEKGQLLLQIAAKNADRLVRLSAAFNEEDISLLEIISRAEMDRLLLEVDLLSAWKNQEFEVFYQPIVCVESETITGFEALLRWRHPRRGLVSPVEFIPIAEKTLLIHELGIWVLREACFQLRQWQNKFPRKQALTVSVNVSTSQLLDGNFVKRVELICQEMDIFPETLRLEVTESSALGDSEEAIAALGQLKDLGIKIYLDDFGTGYSCLSRLYQLSIDSLKIDRSFVSQHQWDLIRSIEIIARSLGVQTITEGVENATQLAQLKLLGCKLMQGYFFSEPVDAEKAELLLLNPVCC
ncbi:EAL domain-containing protein [Oscillatoria salina]|uniref:EAL domain-containing protein n=1 Tax=Oscillatoria salina TaxID=331517 RepID=UPI0013B6A233|nr:EAL domain-containing protein [Oscillatoria salina]MBZ8181253.1 EAL domain-containing protein [Oscillatoria salina IIICB1]NET90117.1 EAL domain-containing protein [Kamptonema sp. SIO1D9]